MRPGGRLARGGETAMSVAQAFSVRHRADLLAACPPADCDEMRAVVLASLNKVAGGWPARRFAFYLLETIRASWFQRWLLERENCCDTCCGSEARDVLVQAYGSSLVRQGCMPGWSPTRVLTVRAGEGWTIVTVGGAARGLASHDADFVVWHPTMCAHPLCWGPCSIVTLSMHLSHQHCAAKRAMAQCQGAHFEVDAVWGNAGHKRWLNSSSIDWMWLSIQRQCPC